MSYITAAWQISLDRLDVDIFPLLSENHTCGSQVSPLSSISDQPFSIQFSTPKNAIKQDPDTYNQLSVCRDKVRWMNSIRVGAVSLSFFIAASCIMSEPFSFCCIQVRILSIAFDIYNENDSISRRLA